MSSVFVFIFMVQFWSEVCEEDSTCAVFYLLKPMKLNLQEPLLVQAPFRPFANDSTLTCPVEFHRVDKYLHCTHISTKQEKVATSLKKHAKERNSLRKGRIHLDT